MFPLLSPQWYCQGQLIAKTRDGLALVYKHSLKNLPDPRCPCDHLVPHLELTWEPGGGCVEFQILDQEAQALRDHLRKGKYHPQVTCPRMLKIQGHSDKKELRIPPSF